MRVVLITDPFLPKIDGIVTMVTRTVEYLQRRGDEVLVIAPDGGPEELFGARVIGIPSGPFWLYPELRLALPRTRIRKMLTDFNPEVIHVFEPALLGFAGIYYSAVLRIPLVISAHTYIPAYLRYYRLGVLEGFTWMLMRARHRRANLNLCTSTITQTDLRAHGIENPVLWRRAVDSETFTPRAKSAAMRERLSGGEPEKRLLLYVGRLSAEKEVGALREVMLAIPDTRLAIVGDGPERQNLERHFAGTLTAFTGYMRGQELAEAYASADLFVLPSQTETLGLVLLEAMAAECPVVACRAGGVPDAVQDGVTGFLFEPGVAGALLQAVQKALSPETDLEGIRKQARLDAEKHGWAAATEQLVGLYQQTIDSHEPKVPPRGPVQRMVCAALLKLFRRFLK
jgi:glycosyltransferase involved in cell wall biosynthesis